MVYLEDILIYSNSMKEHLNHLELALRRLREHRLYAKLKKFAFMQIELLCLGHILSEKGIDVYREKVSGVENWEIPKCLKEVQSFLGLCNCSRRFVKNYAMIAAPLTDLSKKSVPLNWALEHTTAFNTIRHALTIAPILCCTDPSLPNEIHTDASQTGVGAVLGQVGSNGGKPIFYISQTIQRTAQNCLPLFTLCQNGDRFCLTRGTRSLRIIIF